MKRIAELDGVRGIAILVVMLHNQRFDFPSLGLPALFAQGWMGVDLFFALSGFLITGILLDADRSRGTSRTSMPGAVYGSGHCIIWCSC